MTRFLITSTLLLLSCIACTPQRPPVVDRAEFERIRGTMSHAQVVAIIGDPGIMVSSARLPNREEGGVTNISVSVYRWKNRDGSNMNALFYNDALAAKAESGLQ